MIKTSVLLAAILATCWLAAPSLACQICTSVGCATPENGEGFTLCAAINGQCYTSGRFCTWNNDPIEIERVIRYPRGKDTGVITIRRHGEVSHEDALFIVRTLYQVAVKAFIYR